MVHYFAYNNTDSFVHSIALFEEEWHPSQGQQEALLAEVALTLLWLVVSVYKADFFVSSGSVSSNCCDTLLVSVLELQIVFALVVWFHRTICILPLFTIICNQTLKLEF